MTRTIRPRSTARGLLTGALAGLAVAGCSVIDGVFDPGPPPPASSNAEYVIATPFVEAEFAPYGGGGSATISGQAFMVRSDGQIELANRREVVLIPWTDYTREIRGAAEAGYQRLANRDPRYDRYRRTTTTDADGRFVFERLPAGDWSLMTSVFWEEAGRQRGDFIYENVSLDPGERADVVISR